MYEPSFFENTDCIYENAAPMCMYVCIFISQEKIKKKYEISQLIKNKKLKIKN
jgi:hypothetical protein